MAFMYSIVSLRSYGWTNRMFQQQMPGLKRIAMRANKSYFFFLVFFSEVIELPAHAKPGSFKIGT